MNDVATVFLVDDDVSVRAALARLFAAGGYRVESFEQAEAFLAAYGADARYRERSSCLVLDLQMPGMTGLELQIALAERGVETPVIFLTAHGDVSTTARAFKGGAFDFLEKPAEGGALLACVHRAVQLDVERRRKTAIRDAVRERCATLTAREREVVPLIVAGKSCKDIARDLGISHRTVELHRARILRKLGAKSLMELVAMAQVAGLRIEVVLPGSAAGQERSAADAGSYVPPRT